MSWSILAGLPRVLFDANGDAYSGAVLKAYLPGTTTSTSLAIDSAGSSPQTTITFNAEGKLEVSGNEIQAYIDRKCKFGIFANATDATANTPFYMGPFDNVDIMATKADTAFSKNFATLAAAVADTGLVDGDSLNIAERTTGNGGGAMWDVVLSSTVTENTYNIVQGTGVGTLSLVLRLSSEINVKQFGAKGDYVPDPSADGTGTGTDDTGAIQAAITACGGVQDIASIFDYVSAPVLRIPEGKYLISEELLISVNNLKVRGDGMFNTTLYMNKSAGQTTVIRFQTAYACALEGLTLNGGVPYNPLTTETLGANRGLVLDQCAHFVYDDLGITATRNSGIHAIHWWEGGGKYLRLYNLGYFDDGATYPQGGIVFTQADKQDNTFAGGESNNVSFFHTQFSIPCAYVRTDTVAMINGYFVNIIAEGRSWPQQYATSAQNKWIIKDTSSNITIENGYTYEHSQTYNTPMSLFEFNGTEAGVNVKNYRIYNELDDAGKFNNLKTIFDVTSNYAVFAEDISIEDDGILGDPLTSIIDSGSTSSVIGNFSYKGVETVLNLDDLFAGTSAKRFNGKVDFNIGGVGNVVHHYETNSIYKSQVQDGTIRETFRASAWSKFNGTTGTAAVQEGCTVSKLGTGSYQVTFDVAMSSAEYSVVTGSSGGSISGWGSPSTTGFLYQTFNNAGTAVDVTHCSFAVFK